MDRRTQQRIAKLRQTIRGEHAPLIFQGGLERRQVETVVSAKGHHEQQRSYGDADPGDCAPGRNGHVQASDEYGYQRCQADRTLKRNQAQPGTCLLNGVGGTNSYDHGPFKPKSDEQPYATDEMEIASELIQSHAAPPFQTRGIHRCLVPSRPTRSPAVRHRAAIAGSPQESFRPRSIGGPVSSSSRVRGHATHRLLGPSEPWTTGAVLWPAFATAPSTARAHLVRVPQIVQPREQPIRPPADAQPAFLAASDGVDAPDDRLDRRAAGASGSARDRRRARRGDSRVCAETGQVPAVSFPQRRPRAGASLPGACRAAGARGAPTIARANASQASIGGTPARAAEPRVH